MVAPPGNHEYVPPGSDGAAVIVAFCPPQIAGEFTVTVGEAFTVTVPVAVLEHPPKEYVTV